MSWWRRQRGLGAFAGARDAPPPLPQVLTQTSICVNTRLADKNMTAEQLVGLLDADDDTVARTLVGAVGNATGTEPYFQNAARVCAPHAAEGDEARATLIKGRSPASHSAYYRRARHSRAWCGAQKWKPSGVKL